MKKPNDLITLGQEKAAPVYDQGGITASVLAHRLGMDISTLYALARKGELFTKAERVANGKRGGKEGAIRILSRELEEIVGGIEPLLTVADVAQRLNMSVEAFHGMRRCRPIPGIKLGQKTWRFKWSEVQAALMQTRVRLSLPPPTFRVESYNDKARPKLKFSVRGKVAGKTERKFFETEDAAKAYARRRNVAVGRQPIDAIPDEWKIGKQDQPAWRIKRQLSGAMAYKFVIYAFFNKKRVCHFFKTEAEALREANTRNAEVAAERARRRLRGLPAHDAGATAPEPAAPVVWQWDAASEPPPLPDEIAPEDPEQAPPEAAELSAILKGPGYAEPASEGALTAAIEIAGRVAGETMSRFTINPYKCKNYPALKWVVNGTVAGKRQRRFFKTEAEAKTFAHLQNTELLNKGREAMDFPSWLRTMAQRCHALLEPQGATLDEAVQFYLAAKATRDASISLKGCIEKLVQLKQAEGVSHRYVCNLRRTLRLFAEAIGPEIKVSEIGVREINAYLSGLMSRKDPSKLIGPQTQRHVRRMLATLFEFAKKQHYAKENVAYDAMRPKEIESEVGIFRPEQLSRILRNAPDEYVPMLAIGAFAGIRIAELCRLDWSEVHLDRGFIEVKARKAKSARRRLVKIEPCLSAWISPYGKEEGPVAPVRNFVPHRQLADTMKAAGVDCWVRNALRHSFASYHLAKWKDAAKLALEMGHTTTNLIFAHYRQLVHESDAELYWNILPPEMSEKGKVVRFQEPKKAS